MLFFSPGSLTFLLSTGSFLKMKFNKLYLRVRNALTRPYSIFFDVILYLPIFTKRQSKNILGNERNTFISHCWTIQTENVKPADSIPGVGTQLLLSLWNSDFQTVDSRTLNWALFHLLCRLQGIMTNSIFTPMTLGHDTLPII